MPKMEKMELKSLEYEARRLRWASRSHTRRPPARSGRPRRAPIPSHRRDDDDDASTIGARRERASDARGARENVFDRSTAVARAGRRRRVDDDEDDEGARDDRETRDD